MAIPVAIRGAAPPKAAGGAASPTPKATAGDLGRRARWALIGSIAVTVLLYVMPYGRLLSYPLVLLSTLVHEMGHGVTSLLVGGDFSSFQMWKNGSGVAHTGGYAPGARQGLVAAGGLVGPAFGAALLFVCARRPRPARIALWLCTAALAVALILVVRGGFAIGFVGVVFVGVGLVAWKGRGNLPQLALVFGAVQLALSVFSRGDYLFMKTAHTGAGELPSDVANMGSALGGPYWFWGAVCGLVSVVALAAGSWVFLRGASPDHSRRH